jgi:cytochrome b561
MNLRTAHERYGSVQIALHWAMLLLIAAVYACLDRRALVPQRSAVREGLKAWHFMLGMTVLILATVRIVMHVVSASPPIHPAPPRWQAVAGKLMHLALYLFMIAMPVLGWLALSAGAKTIQFFGLELRPLVDPDQGLGKQFEEIHETIGTLGYFLIGLHAAAALVHHYFFRDNTLRRMLPRRWARARRQQAS